MSFDLMVFEPAAAPVDHPAFLAWYDDQMEWAEDHGYDDPKVSTPALKTFFMEAIETYPAMNGPYGAEDADDGEDEIMLSDYSVGKVAIYISFAWSQAEAAYADMLQLAAKHRLGFFESSSDRAAVWLPDGNGGLEIASTA